MSENEALVSGASTAANGSGDRAAGGLPTLPETPVASLYVGGLSHDVTEAMLIQKFLPVGPIISVRVFADPEKNALGYAYVNFTERAHAETALLSMNCDPMGSSSLPMRIMWYQKEPATRWSDESNVFIKNLHPAIDDKSLLQTMSVFGDIQSCKIARDRAGVSKGHGFVQFTTEAAAKEAIRRVNGLNLCGRTVFVGKFVPRAERHTSVHSASFFTGNSSENGFRAETPNRQPQSPEAVHFNGPVPTFSHVPLQSVPVETGPPPGFIGGHFASPQRFDMRSSGHGVNNFRQPTYMPVATRFRQPYDNQQFNWQPSPQVRANGYPPTAYRPRNMMDSTRLPPLPASVQDLSLSDLTDAFGRFQMESQSNPQRPAYYNHNSRSQPFPR